MSAQLFSLIYHDVVERSSRDAAGFPGDVAGVYKLGPDAFLAHLHAIAATGVRIGRPQESPQAMITFDDGGGSALWVADALEQHGFRGVFFVVTERIGTKGFSDAAAIRELVQRGHEVGSHSHTHPAYMARLDRARLSTEWVTSRTILGELLGREPDGAAVPGGSVSAGVIEEAAGAGYKYVCTSTPRARITMCAGIPVLGRFTIWASDSPERAAALVAGKPGIRARRWISWQLKSGAKRLAPGIYESARAARAGGSVERNEASRAI